MCYDMCRYANAVLSMKTPISKPGRLFQDLVAAIEETLSSRGVHIQSPAHLPDKDTGTPREIDCLIKSTIGPHPVTIMEECRDHRRPVGLPYIEQVDRKKKSVGADKAIVVSRSGFYKTALTKARALDIETYSLLEDTRAPPEGLKNITFWWEILHHSVSRVNFGIKAVEEAELSIKQDLGQFNSMYKVILDSTGTPLASIRDMVYTFLDSQAGTAIRSQIVPGEPAIQVRFIVEFPDNSLFFKAKGQLRSLKSLQIHAKFWKEEKQLPFDFNVYMNEMTSNIVAETATAIISNLDHNSMFTLVKADGKVTLTHQNYGKPMKIFGVTLRQIGSTTPTS